MLALQRIVNILELCLFDYFLIIKYSSIKMILMAKYKLNIPGLILTTLFIVGHMLFPLSYTLNAITFALLK